MANIPKMAQYSSSHREPVSTTFFCQVILTLLSVWIGRLRSREWEDSRCSLEVTHACLSARERNKPFEHTGSDSVPENLIS